MARKIFLILLALAISGVAQEDKPRKPSTAEERQAALRLISSLENDPLQKDAKQWRASLIQWVSRVPDVNVTVCDTIPEIMDLDKPWNEPLLGQLLLGNLAFVIRHPDLEKDHLLAQAAGITGALRAYQSIRKAHPDAHVPRMDELLEEERTGDLADYVEDQIKSCKLPPAEAQDGSETKKAFADRHYKAGQKFHDEGQYTLAILEYRRALKAQPDGDGIHYEMGNTLWTMRQYDKALDHLNRALALNPKCWLCHQAMGNIFDDQDKPEEAKAHFLKAIELAPKQAQPHYNYGVLLHRIGRDQEAYEEFETCLHLDPNYKSSYRLEGDVLAAKGQYSNAEAKYRKFLELEKSGDRFERVQRRLKPTVHVDPKELDPNSAAFSAYTRYGVVRGDWMGGVFQANNPGAKDYIPTLREHTEALNAVALEWKKAKGQATDADLDRLLAIFEGKHLDAFAVMACPEYLKAECSQWRKQHAEAVRSFTDWAAANKISTAAIRQPFSLEWMGKTW